MAVTEREISNTLEWLKNTKHITVNIEWLEACLSWLKSRGNRYAHLKNDVYEQWLMTDLSESGCHFLPDEILTIPKTFTQEIAILQMNSIVDIGASAYSQLKKLKNEINDDTSVDEETTQAWQPKPCRMLKLELTDGEQTIGGMEYQPMRKLSTDLKPGTKILIKENTLCRSGMLFLTDDNVEILGGKVLHMVGENSQINILQRLVRKAKGDDNDDGEKTEDNRYNVPQNNDGSQNFNEETTSQNDLESLLNDDNDFLAELDDNTINGVNSNDRINQSRSSTQPVTIVDDCDNDVVFDDQDIMDDELLRYIEENADDFS